MKAFRVKMGERVVRCTRKITTNATAASDTMEHTAKKVTSCHVQGTKMDVV